MLTRPQFPLSKRYLKFHLGQILLELVRSSLGASGAKFGAALMESSARSRGRIAG